MPIIPFVESLGIPRALRDIIIPRYPYHSLFGILIIPFWESLGMPIVQRDRHHSLWDPYSQREEIKRKSEGNQRIP